MSWTTLRLQVVTPLFGGDDPDSGGTPIRVPSIRGVLRFWFRAIAAAHAITDLEALAEAERAVFGSAGHPSEIQLRIDGQPTASGTGTRPDWTGGAGHGNRFHGARYLLGQGLWSYQTGLTRPFVAPGEEVVVRIRLSDDHRLNHQLLLSIWAWLTYGGLGARTRRGFGQLRCIDIGEQIPAPFRTALVDTPDAASWQQLAGTGVPALLRHPDRLGWTGWSDTDPSPDDHLPEFPALTPTWWAGTLAGDTDPSLGAALDNAGRVWRNFRAVKPTNHIPNQNTRSPEWAGAIHGTDRRYPVAALGLPVGYYSTRSGFKAEINPVRPGTAEPEVLRRASPIWLRPVPVADNDWRLFSHVFWARLLPAGTELRVDGHGNGRTLDVPSRLLCEAAWDSWLDGYERIRGDFYTATS